MQNDFAASGVLEEIGASFGDDNADLLRDSLVQTHLGRHVAGRTARFRSLAGLFNQDSDRLPHDYFHLRIETLVPAPGFEEISNSCDRRLAPPNPSPRPPPLVKPSERAWL